MGAPSATSQIARLRQAYEKFASKQEVNHCEVSTNVHEALKKFAVDEGFAPSPRQCYKRVSAFIFDVRHGKEYGAGAGAAIEKNTEIKAEKG
jgi:hypothetical protein